MSAKRVIRSKSLNEAKAMVREGTAAAVLEGLARQIEVAREAADRVKREGIVVRDMKGSVIAHPAIKIEADATKLIADLVAKNRRVTR